jgi:hypothetical protein
MTTSQRQKYIEKLRNFPVDLEALVTRISNEQLDCCEAREEWSVRQIVHHIADAHMNGIIRIKLALTEDHPTVNPYDQASWAELPDYMLPVENSLLVIKGLHIHYVVLLSSLTAQQWVRPYTHPDEGDLVVEDLARIYAEHGYEHLAQIQRALSAGLRK